MAMRTTPEDVTDVLSPGGDYKQGKPVIPFMTAANSLVDWIQSNAADYGATALSTANAKVLETWLAAFYYKCSDQQLSSTSNKASASFRGATGGKGFGMNNYGEVAMTLDTTGLLKAMDKGAIVGVDWIGKVPTDQIDYVERR